MCGGPLVVGHHALRDGELLGERGLADAGFLPQCASRVPKSIAASRLIRLGMNRLSAMGRDDSRAGFSVVMDGGLTVYTLSVQRT